MKRALCLLVILTLLLSLCPAGWGVEAASAAPPDWIPAEDYLRFPDDPVYEEGNWARVLKLRTEAQQGALLPQEGRDWAQGSAGECYETGLLRLKYAENAGQMGDEEARAAFLSAGKAFEAAESTWYDQGRGRDEIYYRLRVEKYRAYLIYHPEYVEDWGRALVPALDALGMELEDFFDAPGMERVSRETRERVEQSADAYWSFYLPEKSRITVYLDGVLLQMDTQPQIKNERTMAPVRALAEALGAQVEWDPETWEVTLTRAGSTVSMTPGQTTAWVDGKAVEMDVAPYADQNRTYFPIRYAAELFGQSVTWNGAQRRVDITEDKKEWEPSDTEAWAKGMAALLGELEGGEPGWFGFYPRAPHSVTGRDENGVPQTRFLTPAAECGTILAQTWNISDREALLEEISQLQAQGSNQEFQAAAREVKNLSLATIKRRTSNMDPVDQYMWPRTKGLWDKWGKKGIRAWDLCRISALCQWGYTAGYLTYAEAMELLAPAVQELAETFTGWDQIYENLIEGYYWCAREDLGEAATWETELGEVYQYLKSAPNTRNLFNDEMFEGERD